MTAVTQPKTRLKAMPSINTLADVASEIEKSETHADQPFDAGKSGKVSAEPMQITKRTMSVAESPHPKAKILSGLDFEFMMLPHR